MQEADTSFESSIIELIKVALNEDIGEGDFSSISCIPMDAKGSAQLLVKDDGIIAGVALAEKIFSTFDPHLEVKVFLKDGDKVKNGDVVFEVIGSSRSILSTERVVLNFMQRMSGIATTTNELVKLTEGTGVKLLDTRKTTPGIRVIEKWAVRIGGGENHRFALYDMLMLKDNHIDFAGSIENAIRKANTFLKDSGKQLKIEIEVRNDKELEEVLSVGMVDRIMLDNYSPEQLKKSLPKIPKIFETEASGGITKETIRDYALTGVNFISVGALTHSVRSLDLSLKAKF